MTPPEDRTIFEGIWEDAAEQEAALVAEGRAHLRRAAEGVLAGLEPRIRGLRREAALRFLAAMTAEVEVVDAAHAQRREAANQRETQIWAEMSDVLDRIATLRERVMRDEDTARVH